MGCEPAERSVSRVAEEIADTRFVVMIGVERGEPRSLNVVSDSVRASLSESRETKEN